MTGMRCPDCGSPTRSLSYQYMYAQKVVPGVQICPECMRFVQELSE